MVWEQTKIEFVWKHVIMMLLWCYYDFKKKEGMPAYYGDYDQIKCLHANDQSVVSVV